MKIFTKNKYTFLLGCLLSLSLLTENKAQTYPGDATLTTQAEINNFSTHNYTSVSGALTIEEDTPGNITDLSPLDSLKSIGGDLSVYNNSSLTNLDGLNNITTVGGAVSIQFNSMITNLDELNHITSANAIEIGGNNSLTNINGLSNITSTSGNVEVTGNNLLTNLDGLSNITSVGGWLSVEVDTSLTNINGLSNITSVGQLLIVDIPSLTNLDALSHITSAGGIVIDNNESLTNLDGLSNITSFSGRLDVQYNKSLTNLNGLSNITSVSSYLFVNNDSSLADLNGLNHITTINGPLNINNNALLANLDGLNNLTTVGSNLQISGNSQLTSFCGLFPLLNEGGLSGTYSVSGNAIDPTKQEIIDGGACTPMPVELTTFSASVIDNSIELNWHTATEVNNYGFEIERASSQTSPGQDSWEKIGFVKGNGNSNSSREYSFTDENVTAGTYSYRLKQIDNDGSFKYSQIVEASFMKPDKFELSQNYPNPFNPSTTIKYSVANAGFVTMKLYNIVGEEVATLINEEESAGYYQIKFNASNLASGIYFYTLTAGNFRETKKLVLLK